MAEDRAQQIIDAGDPLKIVGMALRARSQAEDGLYCECDEPILHGYDLMCGGCLRENKQQIERREAAMRAPHPFEQGRDRRLPMCEFCSGWKDDPRHTEEKPDA